MVLVGKIVNFPRLLNNNFFGGSSRSEIISMDCCASVGMANGETKLLLPQSLQKCIHHYQKEGWGKNRTLLYAPSNSERFRQLVFNTNTAKV